LTCRSTRIAGSVRMLCEPPDFLAVTLFSSLQLKKSSRCSFAMFFGETRTPEQAPRCSEYARPEILVRTGTGRGLESPHLALLEELTMTSNRSRASIKNDGRNFNDQRVTNTRLHAQSATVKEATKLRFENLSPRGPKGNVVKVKRNGSNTRCKGNCQKAG